MSRLWRVLLLAQVCGRALAQLRYVVSYALYTLREDSREREQCLANLDVFLSRAVAETETHEMRFVFVRSHLSLETEALRVAARDLNNVKLVTVKGNMHYLQAHARALDDYLDKNDVFILLTCGARGPYDSTVRFESEEDRPQEYFPFANVEWVTAWSSKLQGAIAAVGATVSCEGFVHIQTYAMGLNRAAMTVLREFWQSKRFKEYMKPSSSEVDPTHWAAIESSRLLFDQGLGITSFDARFSGVSSLSNEICLGFNASSPRLLNPTACYDEDPENSEGCNGVEPCEVQFVNYGPEVLLEGLVPPSTQMRVNEEDSRVDRETKPVMCPELVGTPRPMWNISHLGERLLSLLENANLRQMDHNTSIVVLVRAHEGYQGQLRVMLEFFSLIPASSSVSVVILPTDASSYTSLLKPSITFADRVANHLLYIPPEIYGRYGNFLLRLCSSRNKEYSSRKYRQDSIARHCSINSPLHYLLVDIALDVIKKLWSPQSKVLVTNADNYYSPRFFNFALKYPQADIVMVNMVSKGYAFETKPKIAGVDLGAYATSVGFLRNTSVTFLNSLPLRVLPNHYHNADGYFLKGLVSHKGKIFKSQEFLFFHN